MKYAMIDGQRREASPGLRGVCRECEAIVISKCGRFRVWHWAHLPGSIDHRWKEPETEWHRKWKECFPDEWQETIHRASTGERHIADVKTKHERVIEFQCSSISEAERRSREEFYRRMCWVVNGLRLEGDRPRFYEALLRGVRFRVTPLIWLVPVKKCLLLQKWANSRVRVYFDFGEFDDAGFRAPVLWVLKPRSPKGVAVLMPVYRKNFIEAMTKGEPVKGIFPVIVRRSSVPQAILSPRPWYPWSPRRKRYRPRPIRWL